jgi:hypothetical protein
MQIKTQKNLVFHAIQDQQIQNAFTNKIDLENMFYCQVDVVIIQKHLNLILNNFIRAFIMATITQ